MTVLPLTDDGAARRATLSLSAVLLNLRYVLWILFFFATSMSVLVHTGRLSEQAAWLSADLAAVVLFFRYQSQFINLALNNAVFMSWVLIAYASAVWSVAPGSSLYYGFQLMMTTLVAFLICIQYRLQKIIEITFWATLLGAGAAIITVARQPWLGIDGAGNWQGGFPHKNVMGDAMVLLVLSAGCLFLQGRWRLITAAGGALGFVLILMTRAATPLLSIMMTLALLPFAYALLKERNTFTSLVGLSLVILAILGPGLYFAIVYYGLDPIEEVLDWVGKERSLTGRTLLWDLAESAMAEKPWLGYGFSGYWINPPPEMIQVRFSFGQRITHFHNNYMEVGVAYGLIGPILLVLGLIVGAVRSVRRLLHATQPIEIWPLLITIQVAILTMVQAPLMMNHSMWHVVFIIAAVARR